MWMRKHISMTTVAMIPCATFTPTVDTLINVQCKVCFKTQSLLIIYVGKNFKSSNPQASANPPKGGGNK